MKRHSPDQACPRHGARLFSAPLGADVLVCRHCLENVCETCEEPMSLCRCGNAIAENPCEVCKGPATIRYLDGGCWCQECWHLYNAPCDQPCCYGKADR